MGQEHDFLQIVDKLNDEFDVAQLEIIDLTKLLQIDHKKQFKSVLETFKGLWFEPESDYFECDLFVGSWAGGYADCILDMLSTTADLSKSGQGITTKSALKNINNRHITAKLKNYKNQYKSVLAEITAWNAYAIDCEAVDNIGNPWLSVLWMVNKS